MALRAEVVVEVSHSLARGNQLGTSWIRSFLLGLSCDCYWWISVGCSCLPSEVRVMKRHFRWLAILLLAPRRHLFPCLLAIICCIDYWHLSFESNIVYRRVPISAIMHPPNKASGTWRTRLSILNDQLFYRYTNMGIKPPTSLEIMRYRYQNGVNLGGVFVLDKSLSEDMFEPGVSKHSELKAVSA